MSENKQIKSPKIILGIDPGTIISGYGLIEVTDKGYHAIDFGCIKPPVRYKLSDRYLVIFESVMQLIEKYTPIALSVETQYVKNNIQSAIKLGMARGVVIVAAKKQGLPVFEYTPTQAKKSVVGNGNASKKQVQGMIQLLLRLSTLPESEDAADALALAICHAQASSSVITKCEI